jgi:hypothetical protein
MKEPRQQQQKLCSALTWLPMVPGEMMGFLQHMAPVLPTTMGAPCSVRCEGSLGEMPTSSMM